MRSIIIVTAWVDLAFVGQDEPANELFTSE
jgi:hypothetical protein